MNIQRIAAVNYAPKNNYSKNQNNAVQTIAFSARPKPISDLSADFKTLLLQVPDIKKEALTIIQEAKTILQKIKAGDTKGLSIGSVAGMVGVFEDSTKPNKIVKSFCFNHDALTDFWKNNPTTQETERSFAFRNGNLDICIEYSGNIEKTLFFDESGKVSDMTWFNNATNSGIHVKVENEKIGNYRPYQGVLGWNRHLAF